MLVAQGEKVFFTLSVLARDGERNTAQNGHEGKEANEFHIQDYHFFSKEAP